MPTRPIDLPHVASSGDERGLSRRLQSSVRSPPGGYDSGRSLRSGSHDSEPKDSAGEEAVEGGIYAGSPKRSFTNPEPRTTQLEEDSQQRADMEAVVPFLGSAARQRQRQHSPGSTTRQAQPRQARRSASA